MELRPVAEPAALDAPVRPPLACLEVERTLHVFGGRGDGECAHLVLDGRGRLRESLPRVHLERITSAAVLDSDLLLAGPESGSRLPLVLRLSREGSERSRWRLPDQGQLAFWPQLATVEGKAWTAWATGAEAVTVRAASLGPGEIEPGALAGFPPPLTDLVAVPGPSGLLACGYGTSGIDLVAIDPSQRPRRLPLAAEEAFGVSAALAGDLSAVAWVSRLDAALHVQTFDAPLGPAAGEFQSTLGGTGRLRSARMVGGAGGRLAVSWQTVEAAGPLAAGPAPEGPEALDLRQWIAGFVLAGPRLGSSLEVRPPGVVFDAAAWVGERLLLVHGSEQPFISVYEAFPSA